MSVAHALHLTMNPHTDVTYTVHVPASSLERAGDILREAQARGFQRVRVTAVEAGERRRLHPDELERALMHAVNSVPAPPSHAWDADNVIAALEAIGHEDAARDLYGDERVDTWFRDIAGIDPDAARASE
jgi:hypothetical protein